VEVAGVRFQVHEGLAAVRHAGDGYLVLWAGAPRLGISATVAAGATTSWTIEIHNLMADAELSATASTGEPLPVAPVATAVATRKQFSLELPAPASVALQLASPDAFDREPFRFAVLSDVQNGVDEVQDLFSRINAEPAVQFLLSAGDLTQNSTAEEMTRFQAELAALRVPQYTTLGNHDAVEDTPWHDYFGRASFSFEHHDTRFTCVDSASATVAPMVYAWLQAWLAEGRSRVHVFTTHIPILDPAGLRNGAFGSRAEAAKLLGLLARGGVDLILYGHIHSYYAFGSFGIPAFISGGGGAFEEKADGIGRHFMVIDVDPERGITATKVVEVD